MNPFWRYAGAATLLSDLHYSLRSAYDWKPLSRRSMPTCQGGGKLG